MFSVTDTKQVDNFGEVCFKEFIVKDIFIQAQETENQEQCEMPL